MTAYRADGNRRDAGHHLHPDRLYPRDQATHLHRRPRLAARTVEPGFDGYSIGKWIDEDGDGKFDVLEVETRDFKGPRAFDLSGIPLHEDNETVVKERIYLDKADHESPARRDHRHRPRADASVDGDEELSAVGAGACPSGRNTVRRSAATMRIGNETYLVSKEGYLMPAKKGQKPPKLQYFPVAER